MVSKSAATLSNEIYSDRASELLARKKHYETIFVLAPGTEEKTVTSLIEKFTGIIESRGGTCLRKDDWGKLRLAHEIEKHQQGRYFYFRYIGSSEIVKEFERSLKLDMNVLRFQTVRLSETLSEAEQEDLKTRAPKEASTPPNVSRHEESFEFAE